MADYETLLVETRGPVTLIRINRPQALNALNRQVLADLIAALEAFDADDSQGCAVLTGSEKAFAAGADIKEMSGQRFADMYGSDFFAGWEKVMADERMQPDGSEVPFDGKRMIYGGFAPIVEA